MSMENAIENLAAAINSLAVAITHREISPTPMQPMPVEEKVEKAKDTTPVEPTPEPSPEPAVEISPAPAPEPVPAPEPEPAPTAADVKAELTKLYTIDPKYVVDILAKFGAKKISEIAEEKYAEFIEAIRESIEQNS